MRFLLKPLTLSAAALLAVIAICIILLANFTAPNPTGRRFSSEVVDPNGGSAQEIGYTAERILETDLGTALNDNGRRAELCFCGDGTAKPPRCNTCMGAQTSGNVIPDFVTKKYLAESKNVAHLNSVNRLQLSIMAEGAHALALPLWVFVRVDTVVEDYLYDLVGDTGGGVVHYFAVPGFEDPMERPALIVLIISGVVFALVVGWQALRWVRSWQLPEPEDPPSPDGPIELRDLPDDHPARVVGDTEQALDDAEAFQSEVLRRVSIDIDVEEPGDD